MKKRLSVLHTACVVCAFLLVSVPVFSTINVAAIQMDIEAATFYSSEPLAKPSETQQDSPVTDLSESFTIHALT